MRIQKSKIHASITGDQCVVRFLPTSVREMSDVQIIMDEISDIVYSRKVTTLVLNFARLRQMTSAFLSKLILLNKSLKQVETELRVCSMTPEVEDAFRICKLQKIIPLFASEEVALKG